MEMWLDRYVNLESPVHRLEPHFKVVAFSVLIVLFSLVRDVHLLPVMFGTTALLYVVSGLPLSLLVSRLRYPGYFLLVMGFILSFFYGQATIHGVFLPLRQEGLLYFLLVASRFACILTVMIVLFATTPFLSIIKTLRSFGLPPIFVDMMLLTLRYIFEVGEQLQKLHTAARLRGFRGRSLRVLASLVGVLLVRSYDQAERVYYAMRLRGYGHESTHPPSPPAEIALRISGLQVSYPDRPGVLQNINLTIHTGERVGVIGCNGSGKTTLFLSINGILKPDSGDMTLFGEPVRKNGFRPDVGLVFQNPDDQLFSATVEEDVAFAPSNLKLPDHEIEKRVQQSLHITGTSALKGRPPHQLSGGEKRMVAIAGILAMQPRLVLYDEPDANLDIRSRRRLIQFLKASPHTMLIASHDLELILETCDRVLLLDSGRIAADGIPREVLGDAALMEAHDLEKPHSLIPHLHL